MDINELFVLAEYVEEKYLGIEHYDENESSTMIVTAAKKKPGIATKTNPSLWSRCKSEAKSRMGGKHSARAMQLALKLYKQRGGGFRGPKPTAKTNKMKKWTKQKWMYLSDYKKNKNKADDHNDARSKKTQQKELEELEAALGELERYARFHDVESIEIKDQVSQVAWEKGYEAGKLGYTSDYKLDDWLNFLGKHFDVDVITEFETGKKDGANSNNTEDMNLAKGRYLPQAKWESLSPKEREATDRKKKQEGKHTQYVPNTEKAKVKSKAKYY